NAESVMKMCGDQWQAAKAAGTTNGETWPQFLAQCREQAASMGSGAAPAPSAQPAPAPAAAPTPSTYSSSPTPTGAGEFASEAQARSRCPSDTVVWGRLGQHVNLTKCALSGLRCLTTFRSPGGVE